MKCCFNRRKSPSILEIEMSPFFSFHARFYIVLNMHVVTIPDERIEKIVFASLVRSRANGKLEGNKSLKAQPAFHKLFSFNWRS